VGIFINTIYSILKYVPFLILDEITVECKLINTMLFYKFTAIIKQIYQSILLESNPL